jgi:hypothetical protein
MPHTMLRFANKRPRSTPMGTISNVRYSVGCGGSLTKAGCTATLWKDATFHAPPSLTMTCSSRVRTVGVCAANVPDDKQESKNAKRFQCCNEVDYFILKTPYPSPDGR